MAPHMVDEAFRVLQELGVIKAYTKSYFTIYLFDESSDLWRNFQYNTVGRRQQ